MLQVFRNSGGLKTDAEREDDEGDDAVAVLAGHVKEGGGPEGEGDDDAGDNEEVFGGHNAAAAGRARGLA